ncbi:MAG TPA: hypothetical protein VI111_09260 [Thermoleophilaceae bacterium]
MSARRGHGDAVRTGRDGERGRSWRVTLPRGAEPPYRVFVNAVQQREGKDYAIEGDQLVFSKALEKERVGVGRWTAMFFGLWGYYGKNDSVDVHYHLGGKQLVATSLDIIPPAGDTPDQR